MQKQKYGHGTFSHNDLHNLIKAGRIETLDGFNADPDPKKGHVSYESIDLTIANGEVYTVPYMFSPSGRRGEKVRDILKTLGAKRTGLGEAVHPWQTVVAKATINGNFPGSIYGYANAKSTSGRNGIHARIIADGIEGFDTLHNNGNPWSGEVWLLLEPIKYSFILTDKECYVQVRIFNKDTRLDKSELDEVLIKQDILLRQDGTPYKQDGLTLGTGDGTFFTTLYAKAGKLAGFKLRGDAPPLDLTARNLDPARYFEPVYAEKDPSNPDGGIIIPEQNDLYLFSTNEMVWVPEHLSAELVQLDPRLGPFFSHFAGYFDAGFKGVPTLEVMCPLKTALRHKQAIGRFRLERLRSEAPPYIGSYLLQTRTTLPKQFKMPDDWAQAMK